MTANVVLAVKELWRAREVLLAMDSGFRAAVGHNDNKFSLEEVVVAARWDPDKSQKLPDLIGIKRILN